MTWQLVVAALVVAVVVRPCAVAEAGEGKRPPTPFYALHNGIKDDKHPTFEAQARMLKELGYDGTSHSGVEDIPALLAALDKHGLKLFTLYVGAWLDGDQPKYDPRLLEAIRRLKGRETMIWLTIRSKKHKPSTPAGDARAVEIVNELAAACEKSGLKIALYPHTWFWLERVEDAVRIAQKTGRKDVGATFNLCHWLKVDKPETLDERLRLAKDCLFQVTINGADTSGGWDRLIQPLDHGSYDVGKVLSGLKAIGYAGPVGLQCYAVKGDKRENLARSMAAWRRLWAKVD